jgi:multiple sugar transport system ATP-binding protein
MADRVIILNAGYVLQTGTRQEIFDRPASEKVGELIGIPPMNVVRNAKPVVAKGRTGLATDGFQIEIREEQQKRIEQKALSTLNIGLYPSEIELLQADDTRRPTVTGEIYVYEPLGLKGSLSVKVGNEVLKVQTSARIQKTTAGEEVRLHIDEKKVHVFDAQDGSNILTN